MVWVKCETKTQPSQNHWKLEPTPNGYCLSHDRTQLDGPLRKESRPQLEMAFVQNSSDATDGWNSDTDGFIVSYGPPYGSTFRFDHSIHLNSYLAQIISVQQTRRTYIGTPFTACGETRPGNGSYSKELCIFGAFVSDLCSQVRTKSMTHTV